MSKQKFKKIKHGFFLGALIFFSHVHLECFAQDDKQKLAIERKMASSPGEQSKQWLAGDHHTHSVYSAGWRIKGVAESDQAPVAVLGGDALYTTEKNAEMAKQFGLDWMVITDHGGPFHSKLNLQKAYPALLKTRKRFPELLIFYGMEFDTPGAEHSTLIVPHHHNESQQLHDIESRFNKREPFPANPEWDQEIKMNQALRYMLRQENSPLIIANHPGRTITNGEYTKVSPSEMRRWNDIAPNIVVGMEAAPGHQARAIRPDGSLEKTAPRGGYKNGLTLGGFDILTARLGGFWDSMLGEGRRWWITANSDSHRHWSDGGDDFWPGEYTKTYVYAEKNYASILESIRQGRVFVATGGLITQLQFSMENTSNGKSVSVGGNLQKKRGEKIKLHIAYAESIHENGNGDLPSVARVDVIQGKIRALKSEPNSDKNETAKVIARLLRKDFSKSSNGFHSATIDVDVQSNSYIRLRGTNTGELEPEFDPLGENPWQDLWFYSNPIFISVNNKSDN